ncbi:MAG: cya [Verrucomicrobia bacterium]|nr:cya [Verrucomicrobiota bacterium]
MTLLSESDEGRTFELLRQTKAPALSPDQLVRLQRAESSASNHQAAILVADDSAELRTIITLTLQSLGYKNLHEAEDGRAALAKLQTQEFDLLVLDIDMPHMDGYDVLAALKKDPARHYLPVIVASGRGDLEAVVRCIELGAEDFLPKPINSVILRARVSASLERKRLRDLERLRLIELRREKELLEIEQTKSEHLLLNVLPASIARRLKEGEETIAERYDDVTVLFADLVDFTSLVGRTDPDELVALLNDLFSRFDRIASRQRLEKIKTVGDCYLAVGGLPEPRADHAEAVADMALEMLTAVTALNRARGTSLRLRIGLSSGPVVAGVIGRQKFAYDLWGASVNLASRMQTSGLPDEVHVSADTATLLEGKFTLKERGAIAFKGMSRVKTFLLGARILPAGANVTH